VETSRGPADWAGSAGSLGERLRAARRRRFVGRTGEVELFHRALSAPEESFRVLFVHGPGGVGKSSMLDILADDAAAAGSAPVRLDGRAVRPFPEDLLGAVAAAVGADAGADPLAALARRRRPVLLVDTYEALAPLDTWMREECLAVLPADALVVIAGRNAPGPAWAADPAWRELLRVVSLRNLPPEDARAYLTGDDVPAELHDRLLTLSHGHPLTLSLLVDAVRRDGAAAVPRSLAEAPDLVRVLLAQVVEAAPGPRHRQALQVCAHTRFVTEALLRDVLDGEDAGALFDWLRGLSFVEEGPYGLFPHDLARDVLDADHRWRDREGYADLHRRVRARLLDRIPRAADAAERRHRVADALFVARHIPAMAPYLERPGTGQEYIDDLRPADRAAIVEMTERHQGEDQAMLVGYWMDRQPLAFRVFRAAGGEIIGYATRLALHEASEEDLRTDPGVRAMWAYAQRHGPPRPGEEMYGFRFFVDKTHYHDPSTSLALLPIWTVEAFLAQHACSWEFIGTYENPAVWEPIMSYIDFGRTAEADFEIGGRRYAMFAHDWRRVGIQQWLELTADRELGAPVDPDRLPAPLLVLSQPEFAEAVRDALRDLHAPDRLAGNPLLRSRVVRERGGERSPAAVLGELLGEAAGTLRADPRHEVLFQVINRTFLRPAPTQERAAEQLHLSFSTYRRYRDRAVARIVDWLWQRELYGSTAGKAEHQMDTDRPAG
jgi:hypothetical protein